MKKDFKLLDVVALVGEQLDEGLVADQVGTIVEKLEDGVLKLSSATMMGGLTRL